MIPHNRPTIVSEDYKAIDRVLKSGQLSQNKEVLSFEEEFEKYLGLKNGSVIAVSNGTAALYLALYFLKAKNKKVIFPAYSCSSLAHATQLVGAKANLKDIEKNSTNMSTGYGKQGEIIIYPQMYGNLNKLISKKKVSIIEDACQSLGGKINKVFSGLQGDVGIFSFYATKMITPAGQGGMIVSKNRSLIKGIKDFINFDMRKDKKFRFNFQMTDVQAAMGRTQLKKLNEFIRVRKKIFNFYKSLDLNLLNNNNTTNIQTVPYRCIMLCKNPKRIIKKFKEHKIQVINPLEQWELLGNSDNFRNSKKLTQQTISLPCYPSLSAQDLKHIKKAINLIRHEF